ncbi:YicC/YloC family endoribonuclease [Bacillus massiliigorillae]|uniref:YicC/YloC family endoribonuclease n=1 Tax=Bacillus massiliigorillae TaxID=1243664 RepID=UPI0005AB6A56|nr:YicC/YloC family endoribonuclease [Bacillus massiliigorillae]
MVVSMTGYGRGISESENLRILVEVKTVNHRFCEYHIRMPRQLLVLEDKIKKQLGSYIRRGRAEVFITVEGDGLIHKKLVVDWSLLDQYMNSLDIISNKYQMHPNNTPHTVSQLEDVFIIQEEQTNSPEIEAHIMSAVNQAGEELKRMRMAEGTQLKIDIQQHLDKLKETAEKVKSLAPIVTQAYRERLQQRMTEFTAGMVDETRLLNEVAIFTDKADLNEEIIRLNSHLAQVYASLNSNEAIGRKLDFLVQEMNREVNTIGSKANDSNIAIEVVEMKSLLEKMKEQIQNIE